MTPHAEYDSGVISMRMHASAVSFIMVLSALSCSSEPTRNLSPSIITESVEPNPTQVGILHATCLNNEIDINFRASVREYNTEQTIYAYWFVDYTPDVSSANSQPFHEQTISGEPGGPEERELEIARVPLSWIPATERAGSHLVELVVMDTQAESTSAEPYRVPSEDGLSNSFPWAIEIEDGTCE